MTKTIKTDIFTILEESAPLIDDFSEYELVQQVIHPILHALGFEIVPEKQIGENTNIFVDFSITNLPVDVIGEVKRPEGYERGQVQLQNYLRELDSDTSVGIITDGLRWEVYHFDNSDSGYVLTGFVDIDLSPVTDEIASEDIAEVSELDSIEHLEQFVSAFSQPEFKELLNKIDLFDENTDIRAAVEPFSDDSLELLQKEANKKIKNQMEQHRFYQKTGFRLGRTAVISISILISIGAIVIETRPGIGVSSLVNDIILVGLVLLGSSALIGIFGPVYVSRRTEKAPQRIYREYFELAVPGGPTEGISSRKDILVELLKQNCEVGKNFRLSIKNSLRITYASVLLQFVGIILVMVGIYLSF